MDFQWAKIQKGEDGKTLLLYRHERIFIEGLVRPGKKVLDIGGWGQLATRLVEAGCEVTLLDKLTEDQYYPERVKSGPWLFLEGDITDSKWVERFPKAFDLITLFEVLEHIPQQKAVLRNIHGMLNNSGWLAGTIPIPGHSHEADQPDIHFLAQDELSLLLEQTGFHNITIEPTPSIHKEDPVPVSLYFRAST